MANPLTKLLEVFGTKSSAADSLAIALAEKQAQSERYLPAMIAHSELTKGATSSRKSARSILNVGNIDHESEVRNGKLRGNPYWVELGMRYPIVMDWINRFPRGHGPEGDLAVKLVAGKYSNKLFKERHEEAKQFIGEPFESTLDSLIQAYGIDKLEAIDGNK